jgi:cytoskeletal protein RodZ
MEDADKTPDTPKLPSPKDTAAAPPTSPKAKIPRELEETCDRYGEEVIGMMLATGLTPRPEELQDIHYSKEKVEQARVWLTKRRSSSRWRERITLLLEIVVVLLIGWEIYLGYQQERLQSQNFEKQQQVLTNLETSSAATAKTLTSLQSATESMNTTLQMQLDAAKKSAAQSERSAKAGEASASTASQALHVSQRAYVHITASLLKPPAEGERVHPIATIANVGHTPALDVAVLLFFSFVPASTAIKTARDIASAYPQSGPGHSLFTLPSGQTSTNQTDSQGPYLQSMVDQMTNGEAVLYVFATASYKDVFGQPHHTEICGFYQPKLNTFGACAEYNKSD